MAVKLKTYHGYVHTMESDAAIILFTESLCPEKEWISVLNREYWSTHPNGQPCVGDKVFVANCYDEQDPTKFKTEITWTVFVPTPFSPKLIAKLKKYANDQSC